MRRSRVVLLRQVGDGYRIQEERFSESVGDTVVVMDSDHIPLNENDPTSDLIKVPLPDVPSTKREWTKLEKEFRHRQTLSSSELEELDIEEELENVSWRETMRRVFRYFHPEVDMSLEGLWTWERSVTPDEVDLWRLERRTSHE